MEGNRAAIIAATATFVIGVLFGYNLNDRSRDEVATLRHSLDQAHAEVVKLTKESSELKAAADSAHASSQKGNAVLTDQLRKASRDNQTLNAQITSLKAQLQAAEQEISSGQQLRETASAMRARIASLEKEKYNLGQLISSVSALLGEGHFE